MIKDEFQESLDEMAENDPELREVYERNIEAYGLDNTRKYYEAVQNGVEGFELIDILIGEEAPDIEESAGVSSRENEDLSRGSSSASEAIGEEEKEEEDKGGGIMDQVNDYLERG